MNEAHPQYVKRPIMEQAIVLGRLDADDVKPA